MKGPTHLISGISLSGLVAWCCTADTPATLTAAALGGLGAVLPDIDEPESWFSRHLALLERIVLLLIISILVLLPLGLAGKYGILPPRVIALLMVGYIVGVPILLLVTLRRSFLSTIVKKLAGGHREATHTLTALVAVSAISTLCFLGFGGLFWFALPLGYGLHLLFDALNPAGVPWLGPWNRARFVWGNLKVGGFAELMICLLFILAPVLWIGISVSFEAHRHSAAGAPGFSGTAATQSVPPTAGATAPAGFTPPPETRLRPTPVPSPSPEPSTPGRQAVVTKTTDLALRKAPGLDQPKIGSLAGGTVVEVLEGPVETQGKEGIIPWWRVRVGSLEGWVSGHYLEWK